MENLKTPKQHVVLERSWRSQKLSVDITLHGIEEVG